MRLTYEACECSLFAHSAALLSEQECYENKSHMKSESTEIVSVMKNFHWAGPALYYSWYHQSLSAVDKCSKESIKDTRHDVRLMMEDMLFNS